MPHRGATAHETKRVVPPLWRLALAFQSNDVEGFPGW